jgi:transglutaminase-like putative cysteine protease
VILNALDPADYLAGDDLVDIADAGVVAQAAELREQAPSDAAFTRSAFEWVRDRVAHSIDAQDPRVTVSATDVLADRVGLCFAKSHLLVALLRAERIPAGFCYQRLSDGDTFVLHGLVAVYLAGAWHRQDPRGNKPGIDAEFSLTGERLAFAVDPGRGELDYADVLVRPDAGVVAALRGSSDALALCRSGLPSDLGQES